MIKWWIGLIIGIFSLILGIAIERARMMEVMLVMLGLLDEADKLIKKLQEKLHETSDDE